MLSAGSRSRFDSSTPYGTHPPVGVSVDYCHLFDFIVRDCLKFFQDRLTKATETGNNHNIFGLSPNEMLDEAVPDKSSSREVIGIKNLTFACELGIQQ